MRSQTSSGAASCEMEEYQTPQESWNSLERRASTMRRHHGAVALSTAPSGSMKSGKGFVACSDEEHGVEVRKRRRSPSVNGAS